jgi:XrtN system VIT domain protein
LKEALVLIQKRQFIRLVTADNLINVEPAEIAIQQSEKTDLSLNNGSSHIYRMYAFGKVLEEQVKIQSNSTAVNQYVELAKDANIVTPISSLIILETEADYANNGIEKNVDTLGNSTINDDGTAAASPLPNQWIIVLLGLVLAFFYYRKKAI